MKKNQQEQLRKVFVETSEDEDFNGLHDVLVDTLTTSEVGYEELDLSPERLKTFFMSLPWHLAGMAMLHGLNDTCFRDGVFEYVEENVEEVMSSMRKS